MRLALVLRLQPQLRAPSPNLHLNVAVKTAELLHSHNHDCHARSASRMQETDYNANDEEGEKEFAKKNNVGWCMRGPLLAERKRFWRGQKIRPSGRAANRGGFRRKQKDLFKVSNHDHFFHPKNLNGLLAFLCIANVRTCMLTIE